MSLPSSRRHAGLISWQTHLETTWRAGLTTERTPVYEYVPVLETMESVRARIRVRLPWQPRARNGAFRLGKGTWGLQKTGAGLEPFWGSAGVGCTAARDSPFTCNPTKRRDMSK